MIKVEYIANCMFVKALSFSKYFEESSMVHAVWENLYKILCFAIYAIPSS